MKIKTFSIIAGSEACNARCPFCISKMTPQQGVTLKTSTVNWRNFRVGAQLAKQCDVTTAMLTGNGEPTLFPEVHFGIGLPIGCIIKYHQQQRLNRVIKSWE